METLAGILERLAVDGRFFAPCFPSLEWMIARRHRIAHHADMSPDGTMIRVPMDEEFEKLATAGEAVRMFSSMMTVEIPVTWSQEGDALLMVTQNIVNKAEKAIDRAAPGVLRGMEFYNKHKKD